MEFTEEVYKNRETGKLCRTLDTVFIDDGSELVESMLVVGIDGVKIVIPASRFEVEYFLYDPGEEIT